MYENLSFVLYRGIMSRQNMRERSRLKRETLNGTRYTNLVILAPVWHDQSNSWRAKCICDCGKETIVRYAKLVRGGTKSCGCRGPLTHGGSGTVEYRAWGSMLSRCRATSKDYVNYGGKGITVCARWQEFENFLEDMGKRPYSTASVDRIDNTGNYEPSNCRWASKKEQANNTSTVKLLTYNGQTMCLDDWGIFLGGGKNLVRDRLKIGWPVEKALSTPPKVKHHRG